MTSREQFGQFGQPDLRRGLCVTGTELHPDAWVSDDPGLRDKAVVVCRRCPVLGLCREWVLSIPPAWRGDNIVTAGTIWTRRKRAGNE